MLDSIWTWVQYWTGMTNGSGEPYLWWSGFGSDLGEVALIGTVIVALRHHNCYVKGCWRLGHTDPENNHPACKKHHSLAHKL